MVGKLCGKCHTNEQSPHHHYCRGCAKVANQVYRLAHREELASKQKEYFHKNKATIKVRRSAYHKNWDWKRYGVINIDGTPFTTVDFDRAYQIQKGKCLGCDLHQSELRCKLHVDHDHATGFFRGLLCEHCNRALGLLKDNPAILSNLIGYLNQHKEQI